MSPMPPPPTALRAEMSAPRLRRQLRLAIRAYARWRCTAHAAAAADCIERLLAHPAAGLEPPDRCAARALIHHWRCLAWSHEPTN